MREHREFIRLLVRRSFNHHRFIPWSSRAVR